jgi:hypothetical protein
MKEKGKKEGKININLIFKLQINRPRVLNFYDLCCHVPTLPFFAKFRE